MHQTSSDGPRIVSAVRIGRLCSGGVWRWSGCAGVVVGGRRAVTPGTLQAATVPRVDWCSTRAIPARARTYRQRNRAVCGADEPHGRCGHPGRPGGRGCVRRAVRRLVPESTRSATVGGSRPTETMSFTRASSGCWNNRPRTAARAVAATLDPRLRSTGQALLDALLLPVETRVLRRLCASPTYCIVRPVPGDPADPGRPGQHGRHDPSDGQPRARPGSGRGTRHAARGRIVVDDRPHLPGGPDERSGTARPVGLARRRNRGRKREIVDGSGPDSTMSYRGGYRRSGRGTEGMRGRRVGDCRCCGCRGGGRCRHADRRAALAGGHAQRDHRRLQQPSRQLGSRTSPLSARRLCGRPNSASSSRRCSTAPSTPNPWWSTERSSSPPRRHPPTGSMPPPVPSSGSGRFGSPFEAATIGCSDLTPDLGSTATPVVDPTTGTVYLTTRLETGLGRTGQRPLVPAGDLRGHRDRGIRLSGADHRHAVQHPRGPVQRGLLTEQAGPAAARGDRLHRVRLGLRLHSLPGRGGGGEYHHQEGDHDVE